MKGYVTFSPGVSNIFWKPQSGTAELFRSEAPHDGFEKVDNIDLSKGEYRDEVDITEDKFLYYKIDDSLLHMFELPNEYAKEIVRRDEWFLRSERHSGGTAGYALLSNTRGDHCPTCWDEINERSTMSNCPTCYGTGMENPYYKPLKIYFDFRPSKGMKRLFPDKISLQGYNQAMWTTNKPLFKPNDVIVFRGTRYRVASNITYSRMGLYVTKQFIPLEAIEYHRPEYKIPIPPDDGEREGL